MIAFVGNGSADLRNLFRAFRAGSQCDPYVSGAFGRKHTSHPHGWGLALYDGVNLHHFRSSRPAWQEDVPLPPIKGKTVYAIFHSRLASNPKLDSPICSHPFIAATNKEVLLFAHNGGVEVDKNSPRNIVDSEWALAAMVKAGGMEKKVLRRLKDRTTPNSALNLAVMSIPRRKKTSPAIHCLNYHRATDQGSVAYYKMYTGDFAGGKVFFSSTFKDLKIKGLTNIQPAPFGQHFSL
jgi:hypothetical protein